MYRLIQNLLLLCCIAILISACGNANAGQKEEPLHIVIGSWVGDAPFYVAHKHDLYPKPVQVTTMSSGSDKGRVFAEGDADAMPCTMFSCLSRLDQGVDAKIIAAIDYVEESDGIVARDDIASVEDLQGKRVAVEINTISHYVLVTALHQHGLKESDVELVNLTGQESINALKGGTVDAVTTWKPLLTRAANAEGMHLLYSSSEMPFPAMDFLFVHTDAIEQRPQDVAALLHGWDKACKLKQANEQDFIANAQGMGITEEELQTLVPDLTIIDIPTNVAYFRPDNADLSLKTIYEDTATFMQNHGMLENPIRDYAEMFEPRFVQEHMEGAE